MKAIVLCFLVLAAASSLLGSAEAKALQSDSTIEIQPFGDGGFMNFLHNVLSTVHGVKCTIKEVAEILIATCKYIEDIEACGTDLPKDIAKIVKLCKQIIKICDEIMHLNSQLCSSEGDAKVTSTKCFVKLFNATMKLTRKMHDVLLLIWNLPGDMETCFVDATKKIEESYTNFLPNINKCCNTK